MIVDYGRLDARDCTASELAAHMRGIEQGADGTITIHDNAYDYDIAGWLDSVVDDDICDKYDFEYYFPARLTKNGTEIARWMITRNEVEDDR